MANINKIRISGTSYDIQDSNATKVVDITQAEYDVLPASAKTANILYNITDAEAVDFSQYWTSAETQSAITEATSGKVSTSDFNTYSGSVDTALNSKASQTDLNTLSGTVTSHTASTTIHVTAQDKTNWNNKSDFSGSYNDLTDKPTIPTVPTNVSDFTNDAGYITSSALDGYATTATTSAINNTLTGHTADTTIHVSAEQIAAWNAKSDFSGSYDDLTDKPTIPTSASQLTNDTGYITSSALNGYATTGDVQTATNDMATKTWVGNQGYLTEHQSLSNYYTKSETDDLLDTKLDVTAYTPTDLSNYYTKSETSGSTQISTALASKADTATTYTKSEVDTALATKQTTLTAGTNITIVDNVISATGGGGGGVTIDPSLDSGSTNAVANSAITNAINNRQAWRNGGYWGSFVRVDSETYNNRTYDKPMVNRYMNYKGQTNLWETLDNLGYFVRINGKKIIAKEKTDQDLLDYDLVATSAITTSVTSSSTDAQVPSAKAVNDKLGGLSLVKLTQSEYDALTTKDSNVLYVIVG